MIKFIYIIFLLICGNNALASGGYDCKSSEIEVLEDHSSNLTGTVSLNKRYPLTAHMDLHGKSYLSFSVDIEGDFSGTEKVENNYSLTLSDGIRTSDYNLSEVQITLGKLMTTDWANRTRKIEIKHLIEKIKVDEGTCPLVPPYYKDGIYMRHYYSLELPVEKGEDIVLDFFVKIKQ